MSRLSRQLLEDEQVRLVTRLHWVRLVGPFIFLVLMLALAAGIYLYLPDVFESTAPFVEPLAAAVALVGLMRFAWAVFGLRTTQYVLTSRRLIGLSGTLRPRVWSVPVTSIDRATLWRPFAGKILGYGDLGVYARQNVYRLSYTTRPKQLERALSLIANAKITSVSEAPPASHPSSDTRSYTSPPVPSDAREPSSGPHHVFGGRYVLEERIAVGGMGTVHRALDERLGRPVAAKVLREELAEDPHFVERFRREARSAAMLSHPNIASIYDYVADERGHLIVMELLTGPDLSRYLSAAGTIAVERAVDVCCQVLDALGHAHDRGVIHRDVKPANIVLDHDTTVKVTDFGIAQALGSARLTATGAFLGSAHYVAPERVRGEEATPASDLYSLGVVLFEMVVGRPPFGGDSLHRVLESHLSEDVPAPSTVAEGIPAGLDDVIRLATQRVAGDRFASAEEMRAALDALDGGLADPVTFTRLPDDTPPLPQIH
ncbi:MAG: protein kinase [Actinomycetota bacterium]|nr:protein kinase [Actinomycetota bacterium]